MLICLLFVQGCGKKPAQTSAKSKEKAKPILGENLSINADPGTAEARSLDDKRQLLYKVSWQKAQIDVSDMGVFAGTMEDVKGAMYEDGRPANTFSSKAAQAVRENSRLTLSGGVRLVSQAKQVSMTCDQVEWWAEEEIVKAKGHVKVTGRFGSLEELPELWANPDLTHVATPDMFKRQ